LRESVGLLAQSQRSTFDSVERLNNIVQTLAEQAAEDRQIWQAEIRQIWEYLLRDRGNGRSQ
jgi:hypothetical protein